MMLLFTLMGVLGGYTAARLCKVFDGDEGRWKTTTLLQAFLVPGLFFGIFFLLNLCIWGEKSSGAVAFTTLFAILVLWFGVSVPLVFFGAYTGAPCVDTARPWETEMGALAVVLGPN
eukprot:g19656.t1